MGIERGVAVSYLAMIEVKVLTEIAGLDLLVRRKNQFVRPSEFWQPGGFQVDAQRMQAMVGKGLIRTHPVSNHLQKPLNIPWNTICATLTDKGRWTAVRLLASEADRLSHEQEEAHSATDAISGSSVPTTGREREIVDSLLRRLRHFGGPASQSVPSRPLSKTEV